MRPLAAKPARLALWRAVEGQHVVATMALVDSAEEQRILEEMVEAAKPPLPADTAGLHYLLFTPFRYPPTARASRFRRPDDPGVFYGAEAIRTACAELGYWRWRFLQDSPDLEALGPVPQTVFQVTVAGPTADLRIAPYLRQRRRWTDPADYRACQDLAAAARRQGIQLIRYESVRDPEHGGAAAVLSPRAFRVRRPRTQQTWYLTVTRPLVRWWRGPGAGFEFGYR